VLSHTSDQHPWFAESRASRDNPRADWYVWADPKPDGTPPNNWLSIFGGPAWEWDSRREQYYLHNFLTSQPDLNFHNIQVQEALLDVARFWLARGVDGFRLDTINFYVHDAQLRDNPPLPPEARNDTIAPRVNPYNHQDHLYSKNRPENLEFLARFRATMDEYDSIAAVGEVGDAQKGLEILGQYTAGNHGVHMCYAFEFLAQEPLRAQRVADVLEQVARHAADGWACWAFSNHDVMRHASRWSLSEDAQRAMVSLLMCLRGSVCLYQGEELGLTEVDLAFEDLQDPYGIAFWPEFKGRDGCRTPMVWQSDGPTGGFSDARPWLPVPEEHLARSVARQEEGPEALLHYYRRAIALRRQHKALAKGTQERMQVQGDVLSFERCLDGARVFFAVNLGEGGAQVTLPDGTWRDLGADLGGAVADEHGVARLRPWQVVVALET